jgi:hypothetical protein
VEDEVGSPKYQVVKTPGDCSNESSENDGHALCPRRRINDGTCNGDSDSSGEQRSTKVDWTTFAT